jgi:hypothetical protein
MCGAETVRQSEDGRGLCFGFLRLINGRSPYPLCQIESECLNIR